jgi:hypothetical protein
MSQASHRVQVNNEFRSFMDNSQPQNPFMIPPDEKLFTFKEEQKQRRLADREKNRNTKIWDKNRPTREGCLKKLCGHDIQPAAVAIDHKLQKKLNLSEAAGFTSSSAEQSNIPVERPRNKENRWKLIEKKREMDLIKEMIKTKRAETNKIEYYEKKRIEALDESEKFLSQDIKSFVDFFKKNSQESKKVVSEAEAKRAEHQEQIKRLKEKEDEYQKVLSNISKNNELLEEYYRYKEFLDRVYQPSSETAEAEPAPSAKVDPKVSPIKQSQNKKSRDKNQKKDLLEGINISKDVKNLIEDNTFEYKIPFSDPDDLLTNFTSLEEKNLFLIQTTQEAEQAYEEKKQEFNVKKKRFEKEINGLQNGLKEVKERIFSIEDEMAKEHNLVTEGRAMPPDTEKRLKSKVNDSFKRVTEHGKGKMVETGGAPVYLLGELENECEGLLQKINKFSGEHGEELVNAFIKEIQKDRKSQNIEKKKIEQIEANLQRQKNESKNKNRIIEVKRRAMQRSKPKVIKKKISNNNKLSEEDKAKLYYIGIM